MDLIADRDSDQEAVVATLVSVGQKALEGHGPTQAVCSLRMWLKNDWAILFSHPEDFVSRDLESDRWLAILRRSFVDHAVRPIALAAASQQADHGWVTQVNNDVVTVLLNDAGGDEVQPVDLLARRLSEDIADMQHRFVMIIDPMLNLRRIYSYEDRTCLPSPLEFVGWVIAIRERESITRRRERFSGEFAAQSLPCGPPRRKISPCRAAGKKA